MYVLYEECINRPNAKSTNKPTDQPPRMDRVIGKLHSNGVKRCVFVRVYTPSFTEDSNENKDTAQSNASNTSDYDHQPKIFFLFLSNFIRNVSFMPEINLKCDVKICHDF